MITPPLMLGREWVQVMNDISHVIMDVITCRNDVGKRPPNSVGKYGSNVSTAVSTHAV